MHRAELGEDTVKSGDQEGPAEITDPLEGREAAVTTPAQHGVSQEMRAAGAQTWAWQQKNAPGGGEGLWGGSAPPVHVAESLQPRN